jgi:VWFA-related protein
MRGRYPALVVLFGAAVVARPQAQQDFQVSVNVNLVVLQATVHDKSGRFTPDLAESDFQVYEDGVKQTLTLFRHEDAPVTVGLVVDHSGSMKPKLAEVVAAARVFEETSNPQDQIFVVNFNDRVALAMANGNPFPAHAEQLKAAIAGMPAIGMTRLYDAVAMAQDQLREGKWEQRVLVVISDGGDNASKHNLAETLRQAEVSTSLIYTIGIFDAENEDRNPDVLRRLARITGGEAYFPARLEDTVEICRRIAHDIRHHYTLGYVSTDHAQTGGVRALRVTASAPGQGKLAVRTRTGYIAGGK